MGKRPPAKHPPLESDDELEHQLEALVSLASKVAAQLRLLKHVNEMAPRATHAGRLRTIQRDVADLVHSLRALELGGLTVELVDEEARCSGFPHAPQSDVNALGPSAPREPPPAGRRIV